MRLKKYFLSVIALIICLVYSSHPVFARSAPFRKAIGLELDTLCDRPQRPSFPAGAIPGTYIYPLTQRDLNYIKDLGASLLIISGGPALWGNVAKVNPYTNSQSPTDWNNPNYDFAGLDRAIGLAQLNNMEVALQVFGTPSWANGITGDVADDSNNCVDMLDASPYPPKNGAGLTEFANFMQAVATRYDGAHARNPYRLDSPLKVNRYILWNEPNESAFWKEYVGQNVFEASAIQKFVSMSNQAYDRLKSLNSNLIIYGGSASGQANALDWLKTVHNSGLKLDVIAAHPYPINFDTAPLLQSASIAQLTTNNVAALRNLIDTLPNWAGKDMFMSEGGYRAYEKNSSGGWLFPNSFANDASWLLQTLNVAKTTPKNEGWTQFLLYPESNWGTGLIQDKAGNGDILYPAYNTFKSYSEVYPLDLDNNKSITANDIGLLVGDINNPTSGYMDKADLNNDGKINSLDYALTDFNWSQYFPLKFSLPGNIALPTDYYDEIVLFPNSKQLIIHGTAIWIRSALTDTTWASGSLSSWFVGQSSSVALPTTHIDSYIVIPQGITNAGAEMITSGNRYWYKSAGSNTWSSDSLSNLWVGHTANYPLPTSIDSNTIIPPGLSYPGSQTITSGNRYWWRESQAAASWHSDTITNMFAGHTSTVALPTTKIDTLITFPNGTPNAGAQFMTSGNRYWMRNNLSTTSWHTDTIANSLAGHSVY